MILVVLAVLQQTGWLRVIESFAQSKLPARLGKLASHSIEIVLHSGRCFSLPMLLYGITLGLVAWGAEGLAFYYIMHALGSDLSLPTALFIYAFSMLVGALSFLPGGLGRRGSHHGRLAYAEPCCTTASSCRDRADPAGNAVVCRGIRYFALTLPERKK